MDDQEPKCGQIQKWRPNTPSKTDEEWANAGKNKQPAWCYYDNDPANGAKYGKLYNWYAVNDSRGLAPEGWKIPSDEDWSRLTDFLGGKWVAGTKMKSTDFWADYLGESGNGTNESGFSGLPGGNRYYVDGTFPNVGYRGFWWSSMEDDTDDAWRYCLSYYNPDDGRDDGSKTSGYSVRCLRD